MSLFASLLSLLFALQGGAFIILTGDGASHWTNPAELPKSGWLGLYDDNKGPVFLRPSKLVIVKDERVSGEHLITVDSKPAGAFVLFHGIPGLKEREVTPALWENGADEFLLRPGEEITLDLGARKYKIALRTKNATYEDAIVTLSGEGHRQELFRMTGSGDEPHFHILWAGDLDGDGRLDLLMTMSGKYSAYPRQLFLSSAARPGELVHEVAEFDDLSC